MQLVFTVSRNVVKVYDPAGKGPTTSGIDDDDEFEELDELDGDDGLELPESLAMLTIDRR